ncbi:MAG: GAF domain-containing sensor histidine kinase [Calditrichaeota bacterium]|nr:MAG: GAF domain-containing sensor histidine kinase [Calditrichota bacterium]
MLQFFKNASLKNRFIGISAVLFLTIDLFFLILYPHIQQNEEIIKERNRIERQIEFVNRIISNTPFDNDDDFIITLLNYIENMPEVEYVYTRYNFNRFIWPDDRYNIDQIEQLEINRLHYIDAFPVLSFKIIVPTEKRVGKVTLWLGVNGMDVATETVRARRLVYVFIMGSFLLLLLLSYFFSKTVSIPMRKLINQIHFVAMGQLKIDEKRPDGLEFIESYDYLNFLINALKDLKDRLEKLPDDLERRKSNHERMQYELDKELKSLSHLVMYLLELRKETNSLQIYKNLVKELTTHQAFDLCLIFTFDSEQLHYKYSAVREYKVLSNRIHRKLKGWTLASDDIFFKNLHNDVPVVTTDVPFKDQLADLNIEAHYGILPVSANDRLFGVIVVGTFSTEESIPHKELEKLVIIASIVGLHLQSIELMANLERTVRQRTAELQTTNNLLTSSIQQRDETIKIISHDLNAPLRNVVGLVDSIRRKYGASISEDIAQRLDRIQNNVEKGMAMIRDVIDDLKSEDLKQTYRRIDMHAMFQKLLDELSYELEAKNVRVTLQKDMPDLFCNYNIVNHIFINLLDNACKYMPNRLQGNRINISAERKEGYITYIVEDNGIGIARGKQNIVFESYTRLSPEFGDGKGLGLALIRNMLTRLNGEIHLTSEEGKGTVFYVRFRDEQEKENDES